MSKEPDFNLLDQYSKAERFVTENRKSLSIILGAAAGLVLLYFGYQKFYLQPRETEASSQMFVAEKYFEQDSIDKAINGDGNFPGFLEITENFSGTESANLANYYLGICYLKKGKFEESIEALKNFNSEDDLISSVAQGAIGDAYSELKEFDKAADYYMDAANSNKNKLTTPLYLMRLALIYETQNKFDKALECYNTIKVEYSETNAGKDIEKYIERAQAKL